MKIKAHEIRKVLSIASKGRKPHIGVQKEYLKLLQSAIGNENPEEIKHIYDEYPEINFWDFSSKHSPNAKRRLIMKQRGFSEQLDRQQKELKKLKLLISRTG